MTSKLLTLLTYLVLQKRAVKLKRVSTSSSQNEQKLRGKYDILKKPLMSVGSNDVPRSVLFFLSIVYVPWDLGLLITTTKKPFSSNTFL